MRALLAGTAFGPCSDPPEVEDQGSPWLVGQDCLLEVTLMGVACGQIVHKIIQAIKPEHLRVAVLSRGFVVYNAANLAT